MNAVTIAAITLIMAGILGLAYGGFSYTKEPRETGTGSIHPAVWRGSNSGWRTSDQDMCCASGEVGEGEPAKLDALFKLHLLVATQVSGKYLWTIQMNIPDSRQPRSDNTAADNDHIAPEVRSTSAQDALRFRALQHLCISEPIPAAACYRMIHHSAGV